MRQIKYTLKIDFNKLQKVDFPGLNIKKDANCGSYDVYYYDYKAFVVYGRNKNRLHKPNSKTGLYVLCQLYKLGIFTIEEKIESPTISRQLTEAEWNILKGIRDGQLYIDNNIIQENPTYNSYIDIFNTMEDDEDDFNQ